MKPKKLLFYLLAALLGGCIPSLHPLYTDKELFFEEKLCDVWSDGKTIWRFEGNAGKKSYELTVIDEDLEEGKFVAHLVKLDEMLFLDLFPVELDKLHPNDFYKFHLLPVHTFLKVEQIEPILKMRMMDPDKLGKMLENDPNLIKHEVEEDRIVLTASTEQLQQFMKRHADEEGLFGDASDLRRLRLQDPNDPNAVDPNCIDPNNTDPNEVIKIE